MTTEEFKDALKKGGMIFDIYGWEGVLNCIIIAKRHILNDMQEKNQDIELQKVYKSAIDNLRDVLRARGHYDK